MFITYNAPMRGIEKIFDEIPEDKTIHELLTLILARLETICETLKIKNIDMKKPH